MAAHWLAIKWHLSPLIQQGRMASEAPVAAAGISSLFKKKKGKKNRGTNLNNESGLPKAEEEKPKIEKLQEMLGSVDAAEDDGWAEVVEKKSVVATGGKQVSDLIDMATFMTEEESTAVKLEKQDIKQAFHDARTTKEAEKIEEVPEAANGEAKAEDAGGKSKGLSGDIFGGAAARSSGLGGGWKKRMEERELRQRQEQLSVDNVSAFPSLKDAMSAPMKPKQRAPEPDPNRWVRRGAGGSAAAAAIKAALGRDAEAAAPAPAPKADAPAPAAGAVAVTEKPKVAEPIWVVPPSKSDGASGGGAANGAAAEGAAEQTVAPAEGASAAVATEGAATAAETIPGAPPVGGGEAEVVIETDKAALVQQFGKKKKKKKKPIEGEEL